MPSARLGSSSVRLYGTYTLPPIARLGNTRIRQSVGAATQMQMQTQMQTRSGETFFFAQRPLLRFLAPNINNNSYTHGLIIEWCCLFITHCHTHRNMIS